ncbi:Extradiol ring-cleavage dioxygenase, class III enzyme, subunit B [Dissophora ornata]|nr:hypothetical protein BGZ58_009402 [Dissophora ornata]KAI8606220.1 Extradiol ring-cleavage dioxygenase, class III enzyme, subunit B [Dissophora ornata]
MKVHQIALHFAAALLLCFAFYLYQNHSYTLRADSSLSDMFATLSARVSSFAAVRALYKHVPSSSSKSFLKDSSLKDSAPIAASPTMTSTKLPVYFISHAGPNQAVDESATADFFATLGQKWMSLSEPAPKSILVISGHWEGEQGVVRVRTSEENQLYYDFYGFPDFMYKLQYPSKGSPKLANRVLEILAKSGIEAEAETKRGVDHGVWVPFLRILPNPDIPIVQMSLADMRGQPAEKAFAYHYKLGQALAQLREENVLIVASGTAVHNLRDIGTYMRAGGKVAPYVAPFDALLDKVALSESEEERRKAAIEEMAQSKHLWSAHPSLDHLLPFHVALGAAGEGKGKILHKNFMLSLSESAYSFGEK